MQNEAHDRHVKETVCGAVNLIRRLCLFFMAAICHVSKADDAHSRLPNFAPLKSQNLAETSCKALQGALKANLKNIQGLNT